MSEFDAFESSAPTEEDPAAAFLAREQDQMAELEGDAFPAEVTENTESDAVTAATGSPSLPIADEITDSLNAEIDSTFADNIGADNVEVGDMFGSAPAEDYSMLNTDMGDAFATVPNSDPFSDVASSDPYSAITSQDRQIQEPEKIRVWREEQKENLEVKDAEAEVKREEWREVAKRELEDWYRHREEQQEKAKKNNREAEAAFCQERDESMPGHEWERVTRLCEFNPKAARNSKDVSRMRSILLQLKQTPLVR